MSKVGFGPLIDVSTGFDVSNVKGKSVVITGGASGLGEAFARAFVRAGAFVTIGDLTEDRGREIVEELGGANNAAFSRCDVLDWNSQITLFKTAISSSPNHSVDIVIANAGIIGQNTEWADDVDENGDPVEPKMNVLQVNLLGTFKTAKLAHHYFARQPKDDGFEHDQCLIMTASVAGYIDVRGSPQYGASKWAVRGLMRSLRASIRDSGVRTNVISPWFVKTGLMTQKDVEFLTSRGTHFCNIEDVVTAVMHLSSDKSINGHSFAVVPREQNKLGYFDLDKDSDDVEKIVTV